MNNTFDRHHHHALYHVHRALCHVRDPFHVHDPYRVHDPDLFRDPDLLEPRPWPPANKKYAKLC